MADGLYACEQIVWRLGVGIVQQALVARALRARLIGVHTRNDEELVLDLLGKIAQARGIFEHRVLTVGRARADDEHLARILTRKNARNLGVEVLLLFHQLGAEGHLFANLHRNGKPAFEIHGHGMHLLLSYCGALVLAPEKSNVLDYPLLPTKVQRLLPAKMTSRPHMRNIMSRRRKHSAFAEVSTTDAES